MVLANLSTELLTEAFLINSKIQSLERNSNLVMSRERIGMGSLVPSPQVMKNVVLTHAVSISVH
jgi:hypothetical protein